MAKTLKKLQGKGKSIEVKTQIEKGTKEKAQKVLEKNVDYEKMFMLFDLYHYKKHNQTNLETLETLETDKIKSQKELKRVYEKLFLKVSNSYTAVEKEHGQFEFDKFDCLNETFAIVQKYLNNGMTFDNLEHYCQRVFTITKEKYHRKFVKPLNSDSCFIEFNTDKITMLDEKNPATGYLDQSTVDRRFFVKTIVKGLKKKNDKKLFSLYHCKEYTQKEVGQKLGLKNASLTIKRLNYKIIGICKKNKIDTLLNTAFALPTWKHESIAGKWLQKYDVKPSISPDTKLDSQTNNRGIAFETKPDFYDFENTGIDLPVKTKPIDKIQKGKRNIRQNGFFSNTTNQTRLLKLLDTKNLVYGSDLFNAFYSKKPSMQT